MSVLIAGGGLAGAAAGILLARTGQAVTLMERDPGPRDTICGEFLSREALLYLAGLGIDAERLGAAPIPALRLVHGASVVETRLPFQGAGLSRRVLDEALLQQAERTGVTVRRGQAVRSVAGAVVQTAAGETLEPRTLFLATGKHDVRGVNRIPPRAPDPLIGYKMHYALRADQTAALRGHVEIVLFPGGYAGLQLTEHGTANLCLLAGRARFDAMGQDWDALLDTIPHVARRLRGAAPLLPRPLTIFRVPYGYVHDAPGPPDLFRLGDQAAVIPSFCGDGMSIALHSAHLAVRTLHEGGDANGYHARLRQHVGPPVRLAYGLYRLTRSPAIRHAVLAACRAWPGMIRAIATRTRIPDAALAGTAPPPRG